MSQFPPAMPRALANQAQKLQARSSGARASDEMRSEAGTISSWQVAQDVDSDAPAPPDGWIPARGPQVDQGQQSQPAQASQPVQAAPVTQAARNFMDRSNETPAARRLREQQDKAEKAGRRSVRYNQMGAHNAINVRLPDHLQQVGSGQNERSVLVLDSRDNRLQSPFQGWLLDEILINANARINILSDRALVRSPTTGYHMNLFMLKTLDGFKLVLCGSMTSYGSVPCGKWDQNTGKVLSHEAFQPFRWPLMRDDSPTWVDVKVKIEGQLVVHLELRGYRSDSDMTVQINHVADHLMYILHENAFIPTFVVTVFQGWRVVACSWEVGGRIYVCSEGGIVVAADYPLCHFECRIVATSSEDAFGLDADRLEFRFLSAGDRLDVAASTCSVPPSWLVVSRVSGPTLIRNANWCRQKYARIESPDQALQLAQLASIHAHWTVNVEAARVDETGPRISAVAVESNAANLHLICESPLFKKERAMVPIEALALQAHDPEEERETVVLPPITGGPAVQPVSAQPTGMAAITGYMSNADLTVAPLPSDAVLPSLTEPGVAPTPSSWLGGSLAPSRRSLEQRRAERLDSSALTPAGFLDRVQSVHVEPQQQASASSSGIRIEMISGSLDGSENFTTPTNPMSFGPPNVTDC